MFFSCLPLHIYLDFIFLSTLGVPRKEMSAGQNFCQRNVVKCELALTRSDRLDIRVNKQSRKKRAKGFCFVVLWKNLIPTFCLVFYKQCLNRNALMFYGYVFLKSLVCLESLLYRISTFKCKAKFSNCIMFLPIHIK